MRRHLLLLLRDDEGQDLVEYALLTAAFGLGAVAAWVSILEAVRVYYTGATTGVGLWDTPAPLAPSGS